MKIKTIILSTALMIGFIAPALAAEQTEPTFTMNSNMAEVAAELLYDGDAYINSCGSSFEDKRSAFQLAQSYIDSVTSTSQTPEVKCHIYSSGQANEYMKLELVYAESDFTAEELADLSAKAGNTAQSINKFLTAQLTYDYSNEPLTMASTSATAKGALTTGKAICMGYTNAFSVLAEQAGFRFVKVRGYVKGEYHVMNVVEGNLAVDVTWNDNSNNRLLLTPFDQYCRAIGFVPEIDVQTAFDLKYDS